MKKFGLIAVLFLLATYAKAQTTVEGFEAYLLLKDDSEKIMKAYLNPALKGLVYASNGGWYHTAKVHKSFGFDLTVGASAATVPTKDEVFSIASLQLNNQVTSTNDLVPTVAGENRQETLDITVRVPYNGGTVDGTAQVQLPGGIKDDVPMAAMPAPVVQLGLGLPVVKSDLIFRFVPEVGSESVKGKMFGIALKHDLMQYFGPIEKLPLHVAVLGSYNSMDVNYDIGEDSSINGANQKATFDVNSYTVQALASINFPIINFYAGLGYAGGKSSLNVLGEYELEYNVDTGLPAPNDTAVVTETLIDPVSLDATVSGVRATIGVRLSLGPIKIFGDYTLQEYNALTAGLAISIR
ncbi:MAG: hypothetical protein OIF50_00070 [Flavobacteriaceae bacterium]|nr:hypothetical protein [Flavobacteriaceae bacterium]